MTDKTFLIYGANGYSGRRIAEEAARRSLRPILGGRKRAAIECLAARLGVEARIFTLEDPGAVDAALQGLAAVLNCAGPFRRTSRPMVDACMRQGVHYLDITGEFEALENTLARGQEAVAAGVALIPGVGFDVVPTDCLAARLVEALPSATHLDLAIARSDFGMSGGSIRTMIDSLSQTGAVRRNGEIVSIPLAHEERRIDFSLGPRWTMTLPMGDIATAFHTTGIPNIRVFAAMPGPSVALYRSMRPLLSFWGQRPMRDLLLAWAGLATYGADPLEPEFARTGVWGQVRNSAGSKRTATLETSGAYACTVWAAVECLQRLLRAATPPGAWTPARAFGPDLAFDLPGVTGGEIEGDN